MTQINGDPVVLNNYARRAREVGNMSDFCYSRPVFNRIFHQAELMDRMMEAVGVKTAVAARVDNGAAWYEARTNCISCHHERDCCNWLECSGGLPVPPVFCPNAEFFGRCVEPDTCDHPTGSLRDRARRFR